MFLSGFSSGYRSHCSHFKQKVIQKVKILLKFKEISLKIAGRPRESSLAWVSSNDASKNTAELWAYHNSEVKKSGYRLSDYLIQENTASLSTSD